MTYHLVLFNLASTFQAYARGMFGRRKFYAVQMEAKTVVIQTYMRAYLVRMQYKKVMRGIIKLQAHVRRRAAKRELKRLKVSGHHMCAGK